MISFKKMKKILLVLLLVIAIPCCVSAQTEAVTVYKTTAAIVVDGVGNDADWQKIPAQSLKESFNTPKAQIQATTMKMAYDTTYLYLFFEALDEDILGKHKLRDSPTYEDDALEIFFSPHHKIDSFYFGLEVNYLKAMSDFAFFPNFDGKDGFLISAYNPEGILLETNVAGTPNQSDDKDTGFTLEMAIPLKSFEGLITLAPPVSGSRWRMQAARWDHSFGKDTFTSLFPSKMIGPHNFKQFGWMVFE